MGIAVAYNMSKGMDEETAVKEAGISEVEAALDRYEKYRDELLKVGNLVIVKLGNVGKKIEWTGAKSAVRSEKWTGKAQSDTPKTDIFGAVANERISLKETGGSQLMSGKMKADGTGVLNAGLLYYNKNENDKSSRLALKLISDMQNGSNALTIKSPKTAGNIKDTFLTAYTKFRQPIIEKEFLTLLKASGKKVKLTITNKKDILRHIKAEMDDGGVGDKIRNSKNGSRSLDRISSLTKNEVNDFYKKYVDLIQDGKLKQATMEVIDGIEINKHLDVQLKNLMGDVAFKKWCVFEAATGLYKYSGNINKNISYSTGNASWAIANKILVFDANKGLVRYPEITEDWASKYVNHVDCKISYKTSGTGKSYSIANVLRMQVAKILENKHSTIDIFDEYINEEMDKLRNEIEMLNEGFGEFFQKGVTALMDI